MAHIACILDALGEEIVLKESVWIKQGIKAKKM